MERTADPEVVIENRDGETIIYRNTVSGARWSVFGTCSRKGFCMVGAVIEGVVIESVEHLNQLCEGSGKHRIDSEMDVPIGIGWKNENNCCPFVVERLD